MTLQAPPAVTENFEYRPELDSGSVDSSVSAVYGSSHRLNANEPDNTPSFEHVRDSCSQGSAIVATPVFQAVIIFPPGIFWESKLHDAGVSNELASLADAAEPVRDPPEESAELAGVRPTSPWSEALGGDRGVVAGGAVPPPSGVPGNVDPEVVDATASVAGTVAPPPEVTALTASDQGSVDDGATGPSLSEATAADSEPCPGVGSTTSEGVPGDATGGEVWVLEGPGVEEWATTSVPRLPDGRPDGCSPSAVGRDARAPEGDPADDAPGAEGLFATPSPVTDGTDPASPEPCVVSSTPLVVSGVLEPVTGRGEDELTWITGEFSRPKVAPD